MFEPTENPIEDFKEEIPDHISKRGGEAVDRELKAQIIDMYNFYEMFGLKLLEYVWLNLHCGKILKIHLEILWLDAEDEVCLLAIRILTISAVILMRKQLFNWRPKLPR